MPAMATETQRDASLSLRDPSGIVRVRVNWPAPESGDAAPVLVFLSDLESSVGADDALCRRLSSEANLIVLSVRTAALDVAATALEWTADHAAQLGANPDDVLVGGIGSGGGLAAAAALRARDHGWPALTRQVLLRPDLAEWPGGEPLAGVAPAIVVGARRYAARLREAGVEVEELPLIANLSPALSRPMSLA
jgi:acetyl esterase/lipase